jgi:anti-anti-sigma factor
VTDHLSVVALVPITLPSAGTITVETREGLSVLRLVGEVDVETVAAYQRVHPPVVVAAVDLTEVLFLSSSAVSFLIRQTQSVRDRGEVPALLGVSAQARRVLELIGVMELFALTS